MDWGFVFGLGGITLSVIALFIYIGKKMSAAAERHAPDIDLPLYVTPSGTVLFACMVAGWVVCLAAYHLKPESPLGIFLDGPGGVLAVISASLMFAAGGAAVLEKLGYPIVRRSPGD